MTDSIPLDDLGADAGGGDGLRRDRWGRLLVLPPGATKPEGYTRYTTIAKAADDGGGLMPWKATMTACGLMTRPGLRAKWEALLSAHDGRPWYAGEEPKAACKRLVEECAEAGGAGDRREQGIALHAITGQLDSGYPPTHLTEQTERDLECYVNTLIEHGVTLLPDYVERTVVDDTHRAGGTFDRLAGVRGYRLPMISDLKTGEDIKYSWSAFAVQLAGYANAEALYEQGADPNGSTDVRAPMPEVDRQHGLIIHLPAGGARCDLYIVDIAAGWEGFQIALDVRRWRSRRGLGTPIAAAVPDNYADQQIEADEALANAPESPVEAPVTAVQLRAWLQGRINVCGRHSDAARDDLIRSWPIGVPSLRSDGHTSEQLDLIGSVLDGVEQRHSIPFGETKPGTPSSSYSTIHHLLHAFPNSTLITEETSS